jgi:hypothetical protein
MVVVFVVVISSFPLSFFSLWFAYGPIHLDMLADP